MLTADSHPFLRRTLPVTIAVVLFVAACGSREERRDAHFDRAKKYLEENKTSEGIIELKNTVQIDPEFAEAYALLGKTHLEDRELRPAFRYFNKAVELEPGNSEYVLPLANLLVAARQFDRLDEVLAALPEAERTGYEVVRLEAASLQMRERNEEAEALLKGLLEAGGLTAEQRSAINKGLAQLSAQEKRMDEAEAFIRTALKDVPADVGSVLFLAALQQQKGDLSGAEKTLTGTPPELEGNLQLAAGLVSFYGRQQRLDDVEQVLQRLVAQPDLSAEGRLLAAEAYLRLRKVPEAESVLLEGVRKNTPDARLLKAFTRIKAAQGKIEEAVGEMVRAKERVTAPSDIHYDLARLYLQMKKSPEAQAVVDEILTADAGDFTGRVLQGQLKLLDRDAQSALDLFRVLLKEAPGDALVHAGLAGAHLAMGDALLARQELEKVVELDPDNVNARIQLARLYLQDNDSDTALARLEPLTEMQAPPPQGVELLMSLLVATGKIERAGELIDGLVERFPENPVFATFKAVLLARTDNVDDGISLLREQIQKHPRSVPLLASLSRLLEGTGRGEEAVEVYDRILVLQPDYPIAANNLAFRLAELGRDLRRAENLAKGLVERFPDDPNVVDTYAWVLFKKGDAATAFEVLVKAMEGKEVQPVVHYHLAEIAMELKNTERAKQAIDSCLASNPKGDWVEAARALKAKLES